MRATRLAIAVDSSEDRESGSAGASASHINLPSQRQRRRKPWTPDHNATIVYQWVKFEGKRQSWVASALRISQSTVSRIVERYEKWLAHGRAGVEGGLNEAERQRSQRWLTYERNEIILASCLRIAGDMEGCRDVSRSVVTRPMGEPAGETEVRTTHESIDRSGIAARFLRLAFQINMQQLKIAEKDPLPALPPLDEEELARQDEEAAVDTADIESVREKIDEQEAVRQRVDAQVGQALAAEVARRMQAMEEEAADLASSTSSTSGSGSESAAGRERVPEPAGGLKLHNLHNGITAEPVASEGPATTYIAILPGEKSCGDACIAARRPRARQLRDERRARPK
jgi:hypothetical protein